MKLTKVFLDANACIEISSERELIKFTWLQHTSADPLRNLLFKSLEIALEEGVRLWLFDLRKLAYTTAADQSWTVNTFFPAFDQWKRHRLACVVQAERLEFLPDSLIQEAIAEKFILKDHFELQVFTDIDTAELWLSL